MRNAFFSLVLLSAGCFVDAFAPEGGGGSSSTEGAGATGATSSGGNGVGASGGQSTGGTSSGGSGGVGGGGASAGGGGSDPSGGGGAGGDCGGNHFLRFTDDSALVAHASGFSDTNDFAFGARLRIGNNPAFEQPGLQSAYVFGKAGAWAVHALETAEPNMVNLEGTVVVAGNACHVTSASVPVGSWVSVRVHFKKEDNPDLHVVVQVDGMAAQTASVECGNADATTTTSDVHFGAAPSETAYFGDLDDVYFKDKEEPYAGCDVDGSTDFHFDFETDLDPGDGIEDDCDDAIVMVLDVTKPPTLACE